MEAAVEVTRGGRVLLGLQRPSPRLPGRAGWRARPWLATTVVHAAVIAVLLAVDIPASPGLVETSRRSPPARLTWVTTGGVPLPGAARQGGGGGGDGRPLRIGAVRAPVPPLRARVVDLAVRLSPPSPLLSVAVDPEPQMAVGLSAVDEGVPIGASAGRGPGTGGGIGEGAGTGIGPGAGAGVGNGSGGGTGGGVYRPGGGVTAPIVLTQVRPTYPDDAFRDRLQGSVALEVIVRRNGVPDGIRVVRPVDRGPLDREAVRAVGEWRFLPGRVNGVPVDVLVTIIVDFVLY